jgi:ribosomal protein L21E
VGERKLFGPNLVKEAEDRVEVIKENLKAAQMRQKSYHDMGKTVREYQVGEKVYLRVSPTKGVQRFGVEGKLAPRYIGHYEITEVCGPVAYRIRLPERFAAIHNVFHVSQLIKCAHEPEMRVIDEANAWIQPDLSLVEHPMRILNRNERKTRMKSVTMYKVLWSHHTEEEATSETKHYLNTHYPGFLQVHNRKCLSPSFVLNYRSRKEILVKGPSLMFIVLMSSPSFINQD